jgi:1-phosphatidylinositol-3-phosphate 5-kinase
MIAKVSSQHGDANTIVVYVVRTLIFEFRPAVHSSAGQIFCSRCASNIIKGSRFGHDGMVRVCNLCLEKLAKVEDEDDDDRRSVVSSTASPFPAHQFGNDSFALSLGHHPQSPFAASQLFGRTDEPFNLYSIAETKRLISDNDSVSTALGEWEPVRESTAPFRRNLSEDEKDPPSISNFSKNTAQAAVAPRSKTPIDFPVTVPINVEGTMSSIQFPLSSPDQHGPDSPGNYNSMRSRFNSFGDFDAATPFIRSRAHSRLDSFPTIEGWRTRRDSTA